jgi:hypothetical protein
MLVLSPLLLPPQLNKAHPQRMFLMTPQLRPHLTKLCPSITTPPVRNSSKHVKNPLPPVNFCDNFTEDDLLQSQQTSSASSSIASSLTESENGLFFHPDCTSYCMTQIQDAVKPCHQGHANIIHVPLNDPGEYVMFPLTMS